MPTVPAVTRKEISGWLHEQATKLKSLQAEGHRLQIDFVENARQKGEILIKVRERLSSQAFTHWVEGSTDIGYSTALLYMDVAKHFKTVIKRLADSNGLELTLRQIRDAIRDARQERGEGKPGSGRRPVAPLHSSFEDDADEGEPDLGTLGTLEIGTSGVVAKAHADAFRSVSAMDRNRKLLVCRGWDSRTKAALARGIAVLVLPELQEGCEP